MVTLEELRRFLIEDIFWSRVKIIDNDSCWEWIGPKSNGGYGIFSAGGSETAHRYSWKINNGEIPPGEGYHGTCVLHKCDNRLCVNPNHLFLGTQGDNCRDMKNKGRARTKYSKSRVSWNGK